MTYNETDNEYNKLSVCLKNDKEAISAIILLRVLFCLNFFDPFIQNPFVVLLDLLRIQIFFFFFANQINRIFSYWLIFPYSTLSYIITTDLLIV